MNFNINKLYQIALKKERKIIGLMSGTSMDGLDIALCTIRGSGLNTEIKLINFETAPYSAVFKEEIKSIFSKEFVNLQTLTLLNAEIGTEHARLVNACLSKWGVQNNEVDLIASHGQTIFHAPKSFHGIQDKPNATLQIGDGDHVAALTQITTISDFRQKHVAHGGEGAPLAVYGDYLMFSEKGTNKVLLNIGGISNFTYLPSDLDPAGIFSTDVGPGNTLIDQYVWSIYQLTFDEDAKIARKGQVHPPLLASLLAHPFLKLTIPKTTGPELFSLDYLMGLLNKIEFKEILPQDVLATLCAFTAISIADSIKTYVPSGGSVFISGGGMHNPLLMEILREQMPDYEIVSTASLGIAPDAKEAILFAVLANECVSGGGINFKNKSMPAVTFGKISFPL